MQYARFQILPVDLHFGLFWSAGILSMHMHEKRNMYVSRYTFWMIKRPVKHSDRVINKHVNHMTMPTSGQIMSQSDCLETKGNVNIKLWDFCETLIVYILLSTFQVVHMVLTVNKPDVRRFISLIESADSKSLKTIVKLQIDMTLLYSYSQENRLHLLLTRCKVQTRKKHCATSKVYIYKPQRVTWPGLYKKTQDSRLKSIYLTVIYIFSNCI